MRWTLVFLIFSVISGFLGFGGMAATNLTRSQNRAESVMKFFEVDEALSENKMDSIGYGYSKPLGSNKTKFGRAQNRRVDILIKPSEAI